MKSFHAILGEIRAVKEALRDSIIIAGVLLELAIGFYYLYK